MIKEDFLFSPRYEKEVRRARKYLTEVDLQWNTAAADKMNYFQLIVLR